VETAGGTGLIGRARSPRLTLGCAPRFRTSSKCRVVRCRVSSGSRLWSGRMGPGQDQDRSMAIRAGCSRRIVSHQACCWALLSLLRLPAQQGDTSLRTMSNSVSNSRSRRSAWMKLTSSSWPSLSLLAISISSGEMSTPTTEKPRRASSSECRPGAAGEVRGCARRRRGGGSSAPGRLRRRCARSSAMSALSPSEGGAVPVPWDLSRKSAH
jgi:hypothetical protein